MPHRANDSDGEGNSSNKSENRKKGRDPYISAAHTIARCIDLSCDVKCVIENMRLIQQDELSKMGELDEDENATKVRDAAIQKIPEKVQEHTVQVYHRILQILPGLQSIIEDNDRAEELDKICNKINANIKSTRSNDANHLKSCIARYCSPNPYDPSSLNPPVHVMNGKAEMGLNHPVLARWLCPADKLAIFDENPEQTRNNLASGIIPMEASEFPSFFWGGKMPGDDIDTTDLWHGIFRSYLLIRVARHIFLGPSFAIESTGKKKRACNAILNNITSIEAEHIAYVCIQARFAISSKDTWNEVDGRLRYFDMYHLIIELINEDSTPEWKEDLLRWWNKEIFGNEHGQGSMVSTMTGDSDTVPRVSMIERLRAQKKENIAPIQSTPAATDPRPASPVLNPTFLTESSTSSTGLAGRAALPVTTPSTSANMAVGSSTGTAITLSTTQSTSSGHAMTSATATVARGLSPLSDDEGFPAPLSPLPTNHKAPKLSEKGKGKRRAVNVEANDPGGGGRAKRPRRGGK